MKNILYTITVLLAFAFSAVKSQTFETNYNYYSAFAADDENFYIGLHNGFVVQSVETGKATYYNSLNSKLGTNFIEGIVVRDGKVYVHGPDGLFTYADGDFEKIDLGSEGARKLHFVDDVIWTFDSRSIYEYDGVRTKKYDIGQFLNFNHEIARIDVHNDYVWISMYAPTGTTNDYYSRAQYRDWRFAVLDFENNKFRTFTEQDRGFSYENTINFQTVSNNEVWVAISTGKCFIYDLEKDYWRRNEHLDLMPNGYELKYWQAITDKNGDVWFTIKPKGTDWVKSMPAIYNYETNTVTMKFKDKELDTNFAPYYLSLLDDGILMSGHKEIYIVKGDEIETIKKADIAEEFFYTSPLGKVKDDYYMMVTPSEKYEENLIVNLSNFDLINYGFNGKSDLPVPAYNAYLKDNNTELIIGGESVYSDYEDLTLQHGAWLKTRDYGINNSFYEENHDRFSNGDIVVKVFDKLYGIAEPIAFEYDGIRNDNNVRMDIKDFKIYDDKIYAFGFYETSYYVFDSFISVLDIDNNDVFQYNEENSCLSEFTREFRQVIVYKGEVPRQIEIDNKGNIWALTYRNLVKIDQDLNCEYIDYLPRLDNSQLYLTLDEIEYSSNKDILFGMENNFLYNLNKPYLDTVNMKRFGIDNVIHFGACSDGNVYITTEAGGLYRLRDIRDFETIEVVPGMKELGLPINHVSYFNDTLYVSTDIGLFKLDRSLTSVEGESNEGTSNLFYPNPTTDYINIEPTTQPIVITSMTGSIVKTVTGERRIDVSDLSAGVYFLQIGDRIEKLVKY